MAFLVLIETSGNQNYIFATNKLRENVGASELTYRVGTQWVLEAVARNDGLQFWPENEDAKQLRVNLLGQSGKPRQGGIEVIVASSGKALLLVEEREVGKKIVREVTQRALKEAPGLDVCGVIKEFKWDIDNLSKVNSQVHEMFEEVRANRPGPALRFARLPIVADCRDSGWPAEKWDESDPNDKKERSVVSLAKRVRESSDYHPKHLRGYRDRMISILKREGIEKRFPQNIGKLEKDCDWLAVVHADGNGLGEIFLNFGKYAGCEAAAQNWQYADMFRKFSIALDICTEQAFLYAAKEMAQRRKSESVTLPILPIVLGGDDLTVVCDGKEALQFTYDFLTQFEIETARINHDLVGDIIPKIAGEAFTPKRLSASAGVAIIKPHFPFSAAYDLAEELIVSAKRVKMLVKDPDPKKLLWPCSTLDFHALYDSSSSELSEIRRKLRVDDDATKLYARPYVVSTEEKLVDGTVEATNKDWALQHHWSKLESQVNAILQSDDEGRRALPNSQLHELRAALFLGEDTANARYELIRHRYKKDGITKLEGENETLFTEDKIPDEDNKEKRRFTSLLDAMDAADFWRK